MSHFSDTELNSAYLYGPLNYIFPLELQKMNLSMRIVNEVIHKRQHF